MSARIRQRGIVRAQRATAAEARPYSVLVQVGRSQLAGRMGGTVGRTPPDRRNVMTSRSIDFLSILQIVRDTTTVQYSTRSTVLWSHMTE